MNVMKAIRWSIQAWNATTPVIIQECWHHSQLIQLSAGLPPFSTGQITQEVIERVQQLQQDRRISEVKAVENFLNPTKEVIKDIAEDLAEHINMPMASLDLRGCPTLTCTPPQLDNLNTEKHCHQFSCVVSPIANG